VPRNKSSGPDDLVFLFLGLFSCFWCFNQFNCTTRKYKLILHIVHLRLDLAKAACLSQKTGSCISRLACTFYMFQMCLPGPLGLEIAVRVQEFAPSIARGGKNITFQCFITYSRGLGRSMEPISGFWVADWSSCISAIESNAVHMPRSI